MKFTIHPEAEDEATSYVAWYRERNPRVAERLAGLFGTTIEEIARQPASFPRLEYRRNSGNVRRARLKGFPLKILYQNRDDEIFVFAVAHDARRPGYWRNRLQ